MIDLIKSRFTKAVKKLDKFYSYDLTNQTEEKLAEIKTDIEIFAYTETSNLLIFHDILCDFLNIRRNSLFRTRNNDNEEPTINKTIPKHTYKILYSDLNHILTKKLKNKQFPYYNYKEYYFNNNPIVSISSCLIHPDIIGEKQFFDERLFSPENLIIDGNTTKEETKIDNIESINNTIYRIEKFINDILFYNIKLQFDRSETASNPESTFFNNKTDYKKEYLESWINQTITIDEWIKNARFDLWDVINDSDIDLDIHEKIEKHQECLFNNFVNRLVNIKFSDITEGPSENITTIINNELLLFKKFIDGDISELTINRINQIIELYQPDKILLQYDDVIKSDYFNATESYIYSPSKRRSFHPRFTATFIFRYVQKLQLELTINQENLTTTDEVVNTTKNKQYRFKIKAGASKNTIAKELFEQLVKEKYVDINSKNDFINAFIGNNPDNKINWTGMFGDLKSFINHSVKEQLIENVRVKWVVTSEIFTHEKIHFSSKKIKDTEITMNDSKIKKIVQSFL